MAHRRCAQRRSRPRSHVRGTGRPRPRRLGRSSTSGGGGDDPPGRRSRLRASLTSRRLDLRSALASYLVARDLPAHSFTPGAEGHCAICGLYDDALAQDLNVLNFERFKWGGTRHDSIIYAAFDLQQFHRAPRLEPTAADRELGRTILTTLRELPPGVTAAQAVTHLRPLKGNKSERQVLLDILGICGVLDTTDHHGYSDGFVPWSRRTLPSRRFIDQAYPACWWTSAAGISTKAVESVLPILA
ncbi:hypothetical protein [Kribbella sp. NPDC051770]|uniref:hypothetical protein n=1 Tax=Kribbella sp. NPDC051770 TaxID=3155413 RepID=UPI0034407FFE